MTRTCVSASNTRGHPRWIPYGFEIIRVTDRRAAGYSPLEEVQDRIREVVLKSEKQDRQAEFVAQLRQRAKVELVEPAAP